MARLRIALSVFYLVLVLAAASSAQERWEAATLVSEERTAPTYSRCLYQTLDGYRVTVIVSGVCPVTVQVNRETGQVRQGQ
ncbi:MAG: hypothetical protein PHY45_14375 [Rhodocyclaceae bacterium]|nr:hypothetical protein [Rhodocyclaceae bacterium]